MKNLIIVTSVINTPDKPFSYTNTRSVFTREERFEQTKITIDSIRRFIPDCEILLVDCTDFNEEEKKYFANNCDYVLNLWDDKDIHPKIFGISKALGEGTLTINALKYIFDNNFKFDNLFKISGRYLLNDKFNYQMFDNDKIIFKPINGDTSNIATSLYKIPYKYLNDLYDFLVSNNYNMINCMGYEILFGLFAKDMSKKEDIIFCETLGIQGYVAVYDDIIYFYF